MSFPSFDPSQGQPAPFTENGNAGLTQGQQPPIQNMQQNMPSMQQTPQGSDSQPPFQGQGAMEQGQTGSTGAPDSKTTLWYVEPPPPGARSWDTHNLDTPAYQP
jgi:hypothetical protein